MKYENFLLFITEQINRLESIYKETPSKTLAEVLYSMWSYYKIQEDGFYTNVDKDYALKRIDYFEEKLKK